MTNTSLADCLKNIWEYRLRLTETRINFNIAKLQIALKEANETGYWLELLFKTNYIDESTYKSLNNACTSIRVMLISSINTSKQG